MPARARVKRFDAWDVHDLKAKSYRDVPLANTGEYGIPRAELKVEKVGLS